MGCEQGFPQLFQVLSNFLEFKINICTLQNVSIFVLQNCHSMHHDLVLTAGQLIVLCEMVNKINKMSWSNSRQTCWNFVFMTEFSKHPEGLSFSGVWSECLRCVFLRHRVRNAFGCSWWRTCLPRSQQKNDVSRPFFSFTSVTLLCLFRLTSILKKRLKINRWLSNLHQ